MGDPVISVKNLGKRFLVGHKLQKGGYKSLRDVVVEQAKGFAQKSMQMMRGQAVIEGDEIEEFWALKDLSFEVQQGEVLGVIGRNGAGKSTLLKVLSRITEPSKGRIEIDGRVASLLEVGTGFHPELTGRENIFLNGAILGMTKQEIRKKFDEIVEFAEVTKFLDMPVKRYSSGMFVRLAFAVAAHLEPEILVVDEVLAVGDVNFQKKCLGKMKDVTRKEGRTILFVSHNMAAIRSLCTRAILLKGGYIEKDGDPIKVVEEYMKVNDATTADGEIPDDLPRQWGTDEARLRRVQLIGDEGQSVNHVPMGQPMEWLIQFEALKSVDDIYVELGLMDRNMEQLTQSLSALNTEDGHQVEKGRYEIRVKIDTVFHPGNYSLVLGLHHMKCGTTIDWIDRAIDFEVVNGPSDSKHYYRPQVVRAYVRPEEKWTEPALLKPA